MEDRGRGRGTKSAHVVVYGRTLGTILGQNRSIRLPNCYGCVAPKSNIKWWSYSEKAHSRAPKWLYVRTVWPSRLKATELTESLFGRGSPAAWPVTASQ